MCYSNKTNSEIGYIFSFILVATIRPTSLYIIEKDFFVANTATGAMTDYDLTTFACVRVTGIHHSRVEGSRRWRTFICVDWPSVCASLDARWHGSDSTPLLNTGGNSKAMLYLVFQMVADS